MCKVCHKHMFQLNILLLLATTSDTALYLLYCNYFVIVDLWFVCLVQIASASLASSISHSAFLPLIVYIILKCFECVQGADQGAQAVEGRNCCKVWQRRSWWSATLLLDVRRVERLCQVWVPSFIMLTDTLCLTVLLINCSVWWDVWTSAVMRKTSIDI